MVSILSWYRATNMYSSAIYRGNGRLLSAKNGGQVISLAAGLSTYSYRSTWMEKVKYYAEVDFPDMIKFKKKTINRLIKEGTVSKPIIPIKYFSLDITDDILIKQLKSKGWQSSRKTVFIIEGISYYLLFQAIAKLIKNIRKASCSGSIVIIDYFPQTCSQTEQFKKSNGYDLQRAAKQQFVVPVLNKSLRFFKHYQVISDIPDSGTGT